MPATNLKAYASTKGKNKGGKNKGGKGGKDKNNGMDKQRK